MRSALLRKQDSSFELIDAPGHRSRTRYFDQIVTASVGKFTSSLGRRQSVDLRNKAAARRRRASRRDGGVPSKGSIATLRAPGGMANGDMAPVQRIILPRAAERWRPAGWLGGVLAAAGSCHTRVLASAGSRAVAPSTARSRAARGRRILRHWRVAIPRRGSRTRPRGMTTTPGVLARSLRRRTPRRPGTLLR